MCLQPNNRLTKGRKTMWLSHTPFKFTSRWYNKCCVSCNQAKYCALCSLQKLKPKMTTRPNDRPNADSKTSTYILHLCGIFTTSTCNVNSINIKILYSKAGQNKEELRILKVMMCEIYTFPIVFRRDLERGTLK